MIRRVEFKYTKGDLTYDEERKVWVGYQVDMRSRGKRVRAVFRTRSAAERYAHKVQLARVYAKAGLEMSGDEL